MKIRPATANDLPRILEIAEQARLKMRQSGNPTQWGDAYPKSEDIAKDMAMNASFVCLEAERVVAYFAFMPGPDPTYQVIENGRWEHSETPYHVLHRVMSEMGIHGVFATIFHHCSTLATHLRVDTHADNSPMRHCLEKHGFAHRGTIYVHDHSPRMAYQWMKKEDL